MIISMLFKETVMQLPTFYGRIINRREFALLHRSYTECVQAWTFLTLKKTSKGLMIEIEEKSNV